MQPAMCRKTEGRKQKTEKKETTAAIGVKIEALKNPKYSPKKNE
jgi:hypothetical protein